MQLSQQPRCVSFSDSITEVSLILVQGLDYTWCKSPDIGLPAPDMTFFLSVTPAVAASRGGFGAERYESSSMQGKVRTLFDKIGQEVGSRRWTVIDADQTIDKVELELGEKAVKVCANVDGQLGKLWMD